MGPGGTPRHFYMGVPPLITVGRVKTKLKWWIIFAQYFGMQHKPSMGAKKEKQIQVQDKRDISLSAVRISLLF